MSTTIIAVLVNLLSVGLPYVGVTVDSKHLEDTIQTIVAVVTGIWIWYQRTRLQKAPAGNGDITAFGLTK